jgi:TRAP-type C4-dicarboxylate transport system permease small subunit
MERFLKGVRLVNFVLLTACKVIVVLSCAGIVVVVLIGVFYRYVLNDSLSWTEEVARFLLVYITFIGASLALKEGSHASMGDWIGKIPDLFKCIMYAFIHIMTITFCVILFKFGLAYSINGYIQKAPTLQISMLFIFISMPLGALFLGTVALEQFLETIIGFTKLKEKR